MNRNELSVRDIWCTKTVVPPIRFAVGQVIKVDGQGKVEYRGYTHEDRLHRFKNSQGYPCAVSDKWLRERLL